MGGAPDPNRRLTMYRWNQRGWGVSPRALWDALVIRPLGMRSSVFDLLPVDHHDQQHDEAKKSESWHHHQGDNPHHPAHSWMRSSRYIGQDGPVWNSTIFNVVYLSLSLGGFFLLPLEITKLRIFLNKTFFFFSKKSKNWSNDRLVISMFWAKSMCC